MVYKDHPRLRGEKKEFTKKYEQYEGSPPLARGKDTISITCFPFFRITPACAGKRSKQRRRVCRVWDHPRLRGEKGLTYTQALNTKGSPPLARGKVKFFIFISSLSGITPACAGKSPEDFGAPWLERDHPRLRGEKEARMLRATIFLGSPPLARGKVRVCEIAKSAHRITPACAGKSL